MRYLPKLDKNINETIEESATQLIKYLGKNESDIPFVWLHDLQKNKDQFVNLKSLYRSYNSIYDFIKEIIIKIDEENLLNAELKKIGKKIYDLKNGAFKWEKCLNRKQRQINNLPEDFEGIENYLHQSQSTLNNNQYYYLNSLSNREKFEIIHPLKNLFPGLDINNEPINNFINRYVNKDLKNIESNLKKQIYDFQIKLQNEKKYRKEEIRKLQELHNLHFDKLKVLYNFSFENHITLNNSIPNSFTNDKQKIKVFISYAREDSEFAIKLYNDLKKIEVIPWIDIEDLLPGEDWEYMITKNIKESSFFIALLSSNSISKRGHVQKELKRAFDLLDEFPPEHIFIIPVRLNECEPLHEKFQPIHWVDSFPSYEKCLKKIQCSLFKNFFKNSKSTNFEDDLT